MENSWVSYKNGNYNVHINLNDGTKVRENNLDFFEADFPESMDIKITNKCSGAGNGNGCKFCHENSSPCGEHGDIMSESFIDRLHPYTELAIGGGNPLEHPELVSFLEKCKRLKLIPSMTVNQVHFMRNIDFIKGLVDDSLIYGLGISLTNPSDEFISEVKKFKNAVIHVINGIVNIESLKKLSHNNLKVLILGYKTVGRGKGLYTSLEERSIIDKKKCELYSYLPEIISDEWFDVVSFDNLSIQQLNPQRLMSKEKWNEMYMGDDGIDGNLTSASMFVDMVKKEFAENSCSDKRYKITSDIVEMFTTLKSNNGGKH